MSCHLQIQRVISSFINCITFIHFYYLIEQDSALCIILHRSVYNEQHCHTPDFNVIIVFFPPVRMVLTVGFSYITFIMFNMYPLVLNSLRFLSLKYVEFCQRLLLHLLKWSFDFPFSIHLFLHLWDKAHLIMVDNIFAVCLYLLYVYQGISPLSLCASGSECSTHQLFQLHDASMLISQANHDDHELILWNWKLSSN